MHIFKRGKVYWYEFVFRGQRVRRSSKVKDANVARDIASAYRTALAKGEVGITDRKPAPLFEEAMKAFLAWSERQHQAHPRTAHRYKVSSGALLRHFRKQPLDKITPEEVKRFKVQRSEERGLRTKRSLRPATVNRELACLRAMFNHALKAHPDLRNPVSKVRFLAEENQQDRVLTFTEQRAYLAAATPTLRDVAGLILETGMRPEEVYTLRGSQVDTERGFLKVVAGKTPAARRRLELTSEAKRILAERIEVAGTGHLFPKKGDPSKPMPKVSNAHDRAVRDSKVRTFRLYDLRHTWATRAAEAGIDPVTLAAMLGHSRIQMVMRYAHPQQAHQSSAMLRIEAANAAREISEAGPATLQ